MSSVIFFNLDQSKILSSGNGLIDNKILALSKLKAFADDNFNVAEVVKFLLGRIENIVGRGENTGYQPFLLFSLYCFLRVMKPCDCLGNDNYTPQKYVWESACQSVCLSVHLSVYSFFCVSPRSQQLMDQFFSNFTDRLSI